MSMMGDIHGYNTHGRKETTIHLTGQEDRWRLGALREGELSRMVVGSMWMYEIIGW